MSRKPDSSNPLSRREFLKTSSMATAVAGAMAFVPGTSHAVWDAMPKKWDEEFDVIVVGSGFAGLAAAYEAKKAGASVLILEKMRTAGGNSIINGGIVAAAGSPIQKKKGIEDSPALLMEDMLREGQWLGHPELVKMIAEASVPTVEWTISEFGVKYNPDELVQEGGHSVPRCYQLENNSGSSIIRPMLAKLKTIGLEPRLQAFMEKILRDENGRVKGVVVREDYRFPNADSGKVKTIKAKKALILAHGGFSRDVAYRMIQDPKLTEKFETTNQPGATSEAWRESARIGCNIIQADWIQVGPWTSPDEKGFGVAPGLAQVGAAMYGVWLNTTTGKRFVNELANRKVRADAIMNLANQGQNCITLCDANGAALTPENYVKAALDRGVAKTYPTLEAVAAAYNIPLEAFKKTIDDYNSYVAKGKDEELGRYINKDCKPLGTAPFYVQRLMPKVHHCMGGININTHAQALDVVNDKPIPGLYAIGEASGGVHGAVRLGSCASLDCLVMGRIAGKNAAAEKAWG